ncbi:hypothetical protein [Streptomyces flavidovirens]|uniref:hypothetical protein n=1 Tax=Streptomyces flavidovirens TaxID=67298 RepID=UPI003696C4F7
MPGTTGAFLGGVMILPEVLAMLPYDVVSDAVEYFPSKAVKSLTSAQAIPGAVSPGAALRAMACGRPRRWRRQAQC